MWRSALAGLPDAHTARHVGLPERDVRAIVTAAYAVAPELGLWTEVAAITGARPSQIARLDVADLQGDRADPRLMMPSSKKGQGPQAHRAPPGADPAEPGGQAADRRRKGRAGAPLLTKPDGTRWQRRRPRQAICAKPRRRPGSQA